MIVEVQAVGPADWQRFDGPGGRDGGGQQRQGGAAARGAAVVQEDESGTIPAAAGIALEAVIEDGTSLAFGANATMTGSTNSEGKWAFDLNIAGEVGQTTVRVEFADSEGESLSETFEVLGDP